MFEIKGKYTDAKIMIDDVEQACVSQIIQMVNHQTFVNPIAIMPDTHAGKGSVVGFTMEMGHTVIPNVIGVDIGCGMTSFCVGDNLFSDITMKSLDESIRRNIPFGQNYRKTVANFKFDWNKINKDIKDLTVKFRERHGYIFDFIEMNDKSFEDMCKRINISHERAMTSIGTLGGGNHFIEIGVSENTGKYWITVHSGSRNFGKCVADYWQNVAKERLKKQNNSRKIEVIKQSYPKTEWQKMISSMESVGVPNGMEYLEGKDMYGYLVDMVVAQHYASMNRSIMVSIIVDVLKELSYDVKGVYPIETVHNFVDFQDWIIRKGSIRSYKSELMIIPFNPKDGLLICEGKSNPEWNYSAPHGAGRLFSRSAAKDLITKENAEEAMEGVYASVLPLDESPLAYKDAKTIEDAIGPTAEIIDRIKPVMNLKCS